MEQLTGHPDGSQRPCSDRIVIWPRWNEQSRSTEFVLRHLAIDRVASGYAGVPTPELVEEDILSALPEYLLSAFICIQRERLGASRTGPGSRTSEKWQSFAVVATRREVRNEPETRHGVPLHVKVVEGESAEWWQRGIDFQSNHPRVDARFWVESEGAMWLAIEHRPSTLSLSCPSVNDQPAPT